MYRKGMLKAKKDAWDANRSKWKAAEKKGLGVSLKGDENVLYLGASSGTTVGQISKRTQGLIFAVEKAVKMAIPLVRLAEIRENIVPLFCDARDLDYLKAKLVGQKMGVLFQDIPSADQVEILIRASELVDSDCRIFLSLKTQSISQGDWNATVDSVRKKLSGKFEIVEESSIEPYHKKHWFFVLRKR